MEDKLITTSVSPTPEMIERAYQLATRFQCPFEERLHKTMNAFLRKADKVYMVGKLGRDMLYTADSEQPFFFHPSMAKIRVQRMLSGEVDPLVSIAQLRPGDDFLDLTLGLGADSIVASHAVAPAGNVVGVEKNPFIAEVVAQGLKHWDEDVPGLNEAMRSIMVVQQDHLAYLRALKDRSFDTVYVDPMFREARVHSAHLTPLRFWAEDEKVTKDVLKEAKRVARRAVVLKAERGSQIFTRLGFPEIKKHRSVSYGAMPAERGR
ncbi:class I SAM-dependent methyltransferase [Natribacillus halophilus]|nr:class I SAM-dependent methyltransferase [Natribacillus halophilus]